VKTERIARLEKECVERVKSGIKSHFQADYHAAALTKFAGLEQWEKIARSMAYAIVNQDIHVEDDDRIGGRTYHQNEQPVEQMDPDLDYLTQPTQAVLKEFPDILELQKNFLVGGTTAGHITWFFDRLLAMGITGFKEKYEEALLHAKDREAEQFYKGVLILLDALQEFNDKHIEAYEKIGNHELAERMKKVPRYPAETFREAVQAFLMQHIVVMKENPYGGNGPGRLDYYLWPYLEKDLKAGRCTLEEAKEIIDELFLHIEERLRGWDGWVEAIVVGGTYPNGCSAVNPLTYIMIESLMDLDILHPCVYVRLPENPPEDLMKLCAKYMMSGRNRAQILYDPAIIKALVKRGITYRDAVEYACGGCMEIGPQGMSSDFLWNGWHNVPKLLELMVTGGICLRTGKKIKGFLADKGLENYTDFESFYQDFMKEADRINKMFLREQDIYSSYAQTHRPAYLISSMLDDCMQRGRNMHGGGVRYHDYGCAPIGLPNVIDGLYAIKEAVFEKKICTARELVDAMKADYKGYEKLQAKLRAIPKYGIDHDEVDALANRVFSDYADTFSSYTNRWGGVGKLVIFTFTFSVDASTVLGATPDGRNSGQGVAHGVTPHSGSMTEGITAALNSCSKLPFEKFAGGASTMWDFDSAWASEELIEALIKSFIDKNGQIFQGNTTPLEELIKAQDNPEEYGHLIVRVGGYSARFVGLSKELQNEIIGRIRHSA